jgi:TolA-binding protein
MILGAVMVVVLVIAWILNKKPPEPASTTPAAPSAEKPPDPAEAERQALRKDLDGLKTALKDLQDRIESLPKPPTVDLGPLKTKIADLAKETEALASLPKKVGDLDQRLDAIKKTLATVRADLDTVKGEVQKVRSEPRKAADATPATPATPTATDEKTADAAVEQAAGLFKAGKYKEASDTFQKLTESNPDDARVWYFAALSRGSATQDWTGETIRMVEKGMALEKAGTPTAAKIDAAFADLNPRIKPWLDAYRKMAKAR